jgi:protein FAM50
MASYNGNSQDAVRAMQLQKRRQQQAEDIEIKKKKIEEDNRMTSIDNKFKAHYDAVEQLLKTDTIGLVTLEDMKKKRELIIQQREQQLAKEQKAKLEEEQERKQKKERQKNEVYKSRNNLTYFFVDKKSNNLSI